MALVLQMLLFTEVVSNCRYRYFLLLLGYFLHPLLSILLQVASAISNNTFTEVDFWATSYTTEFDHAHAKNILNGDATV